MTEEKPIADSVQEIILESISDGVFTVDHHWRITSFNRAAEEITGVERGEAIGRYCWEVFRSNMCEVDCALKRTMQEGKSFVSSSTYIINGSRERIPITVSTAPLVNEQGEILGGVETFRDHSLVEELRRELAGQYQIGDMVSRSQAMTRILSILPQVAESDSTVLISGETGTGKELLARAIHSLSSRSEKLFTAINCGALPDTLLESELFGYKAGAFTGAEKDKPGLFAAAADGTILLDEIGETSQAFQVRLLRVLEEREFQPLGSVEKIKTTARIIAATNRELSEMIEAGDFRRDLYYRINIVRLQLPPLRARMEDLPLLIDRFVTRMNTRQNRTVSGVSTRAMSRLLAHDYPGNIRELENIIEHAFVLCHNGEIGVEHLPGYLQDLPAHDAGRVVPDAPLQALDQAVQSAETEAIVAALKQHGYNRTAAAKSLGMHKATLHRKLKKLNISLPAVDGRSSHFNA
ncbi:sigma-54 interaction domain-containing protein [Desulfopila aestuarii]|uniref:PAS domain S-box-containing protein n=1 Tax=Desulfopila aestuarii DSM 18488 TaxID=1121416 RepID=A0A1M7Y5X3_9BACT|nr:sigma 54-interacting transcriptional regulator [Desulfopila aestuarii]SHO47999.1 PAS domain S-box-containing protein [Desulfopila aestuarii DSM 18488]